MFSWIRSFSKLPSDEPLYERYDESVWRLRWLRRAPSRRTAAGIVFLSILACFFLLAKGPSFGLANDKQETALDGVVPQLPPLYPQYREYERQLPQHDLNLAYPEGSSGKYFLIANHCRRKCHSLFYYACQYSIDYAVQGRVGATSCKNNFFMHS